MNTSAWGNFFTASAVLHRNSNLQKSEFECQCCSIMSVKMEYPRGKLLSKVLCTVSLLLLEEK